MAKNTSSVQEEAPTHGLHCKTWVLRVSIHCQGCKRKVSKILLAIHGVYTVSVDMKKQRATVTGNVEAETLIRKLSNKGKRASIYDEDSSNKLKNPKANREGNQEEEKNNQKTKKKKQKQKQSENRGAQEEEEAKAVFIQDENSSPKIQTAAKDSPGNRSSSEKKRREGKSKAEKKGDQAQHDSSNIDPNSASSSSVPPFSSGYNRYQQMTTNQVLPSPYPYPPQQYFYFPAAVNAAPNPYFLYAQQQANPFGYQSQLPPPQPSMGLDSSLQIFSDENVNGCSVM